MSQLEELIARCDEALAGRMTKNERALIVSDYYLGYQEQVREMSGAEIDFQRLNPDEIDNPTIRSIRTLLLSFKEKRDHELAVAGASVSTISAIAQSSASIEATFSNTVLQIQALPDEVLNGSQKQEIAKLMQDVEDSKGDKSKLKKAGEALANWLFDQSIKAIPIVMPYLTQAIQSALR